MPCFDHVSSDSFASITSGERAFIEAIVTRAPEVLAPILTQLDDARVCDDGSGWLIVRDARGAPCSWPEGHPFNIVLPRDQHPRPQGCYDIMLWFHRDGQLQAIELLMLENAPLELHALARWLNT